VLTSEWRLVKPKKGIGELYRIREDPAQQKDVATQYPDVIKKLESDYSRHWDALNINRALERPVLSEHATLRLSSDITRDNSPITQQAVRKAMAVKNPMWLLEVSAPGRFRFEVRRWPREVEIPMTAGLPPTKDPEIEYIGHRTWRIDVPGVALDLARAQLKLSGLQPLTQDVSKGAQGVVFDVDLTAGPVDLEAWFIQSNGKRLGAYYVYAERLK